MERPLYILPFRVIVASIAVAVLLGALGGGITAWMLVERVVGTTATGERVIERIERISADVSDVRTSAAQRLSERLALLLDDRGAVRGQAIPVTGDGVFVALGVPPRASGVRLQMRDGAPVPASVIRVYPEAQVFFLRSALSVPTVDVGDVPLPLPGTEVMAVALHATPTLGPQVRSLRVERQEVQSELHLHSPAIGRVAVTSESPPVAFEGAPVLLTDGSIGGLVRLGANGAFLIPISTIAPLLDDTLRHPDETVVRALGGMRGVWEVPAFGSAPVFRVTEVDTQGPFAAARLQAGDHLRGVDGEDFSTTLPLFRSLLRAARGGEELSVRIQRGETDETLSLRPALQ